MICECPCACIEPPITPKLIAGMPSLVTNAGMMVWNGRFFGATTFACPARRLKP